MHRVAAWVVVFAFTVGLASAQEIYIPNYRPRISQRVLFGFTLQEAAAFASQMRAAQVHGQRGGRWIRALSAQLGLSMPDTEEFMRAAVAYRLEELELCRKYAPAMAAFRQRYFPRGRALSRARPPTPPELQAFEAGRVGLIRKYRLLIASRLGPAKFAALDAKVRKRVSPDVQVYSGGRRSQRGIFGFTALQYDARAGLLLGYSATGVYGDPEPLYRLSDDAGLAAPDQHERYNRMLTGGLGQDVVGQTLAFRPSVSGGWVLTGFHSLTLEETESSCTDGRAVCYPDYDDYEFWSGFAWDGPWGFPFRPGDHPNRQSPSPTVLLGSTYDLADVSVGGQAGGVHGPRSR